MRRVKFLGNGKVNIQQVAKQVPEAVTYWLEYYDVLFAVQIKESFTRLRQCIGIFAVDNF